MPVAPEEREELARAHFDAWRRRTPGTLTWETFGESHKERFYELADVAIAAGFGKQPDPEVTDEMVERAWEGWSSTVGTRRMRAALEAALGVTA